MKSKITLSKSLIYIIISSMLYIIMFLKVSTPDSTLEVGGSIMPDPVFWLGFTIVTMTLGFTLTTIIKFRHKRESFLLSRSVGFMMFEMAFTSLAGISIMDAAFPSLNLNPWILTSISGAATAYAMTYLNVLLWRGSPKWTSKLILLAGNNSQRLCLISSFTLFAGVIIGAIGSIDQPPHIYFKVLFFGFALLVATIYLRTAYKVRTNRVRSKYLQLADYALPTASFIATSWFLISWLSTALNPEHHKEYLIIVSSVGVGISLLSVPSVTTLRWIVFKTNKMETMDAVMDKENYSFYEIPPFMTIFLAIAKRKELLYITDTLKKTKNISKIGSFLKAMIETRPRLKK